LGEPKRGQRYRDGAMNCQWTKMELWTLIKRWEGGLVRVRRCALYFIVVIREVGKLIQTEGKHNRTAGNVLINGISLGWK
jgi:hypothetical protein